MIPIYDLFIIYNNSIIYDDLINKIKYHLSFSIDTLVFEFGQFRSQAEKSVYWYNLKD